MKKNAMAKMSISEAIIATNIEHRFEYFLHNFCNCHERESCVKIENFP